MSSDFSIRREQNGVQCLCLSLTRLSIASMEFYISFNSYVDTSDGIRTSLLERLTNHILLHRLLQNPGMKLGYFSVRGNVDRDSRKVRRLF